MKIVSDYATIPSLLKLVKPAIVKLKMINASMDELALLKGAAFHLPQEAEACPGKKTRKHVDKLK